MTVIKESYLFTANTYGFLHHPSLTFHRLRRDRSQLILFPVIWLLIIMAGLFFLLLMRFVYRRYVS